MHAHTYTHMNSRMYMHTHAHTHDDNNYSNFERSNFGILFSPLGIFRSYTSVLKIGTPVATLQGTWHYRVSVGTGWTGVSTLYLDGIENVIGSLYLSMALHAIV